ncbi:MAG: hypothetical protein NVSMB68_15050 [Thermoanaerobaculia bacterium]
MGKREVRVIVVRKWATVVLLVIVSGAMVAMLYYLSGKAYSNGREPLRDLILRLVQRDPVSSNAVLASIMPAIANILFFLPWGFLMFLALDVPSRNRARTYCITVVVGALFAVAMEVWQTFLPTPVLALPDTIARGTGALTGAMLAHVRKRVRLRFDY